MKNILVPFDFSRHAIVGFRTALDLAHRLKLTIHLLHVIDVPYSDDSLLMPTLNFEEEIMKDSENKALNGLQEINKKYNTRSYITTRKSAHEKSTKIIKNTGLSIF